MSNSLAPMAHFLTNLRIPLRLACKTKSGWPMAVSLWYLYDDGHLFCATQQSARVISYLEHDSRCAFEISADLPPYCGVRGQAIARIDHELGAEILEQLLIRYLGDTDNQLATLLLAKSKTEVAVVLEPKRIFSWDFTQRMSDISFDHPTEKICP